MHQTWVGQRRHVGLDWRLSRQRKIANATLTRAGVSMPRLLSGIVTNLFLVRVRNAAQIETLKHPANASRRNWGTASETIAVGIKRVVRNRNRLIAAWIWRLGRYKPMPHAWPSQIINRRPNINTSASSIFQESWPSQELKPVQANCCDIRG